ncbi:MAG: carotenoid oxygenase family protein, partial [Acidimicrobiales bacterium]
MTATDVDLYGPAFHREGNYRPIGEEVTAFDLPVTGELPTSLCGSFLRNGSNPITASAHWFFGEGMIHGLRLDQGRARWFRNRWVRTASFKGTVAFRDTEGQRNLNASKANTHVVRHAGRILALVESSFPYLVSPELETVGPWDFAGRLTTAMTAHPKVCPTTGEMHFFGYDLARPYLTYHVADAAGRLALSRPVEVPAATMMHDFNLTERFVVFMDLPIVFDLAAARAGSMFPFCFDATFGARLGVLRRDDPHGEVRWFEIEPCYVFHPLNAFDDGDRVVLDVVRYDRMFERVRMGPDDGAPAWHRWTLDTGTGTV